MKLNIRNKRALSMSVLMSLVLLAAFLLIVLIAYVQMNKAGGAINASLESNISRLTELTGNIE